MIRGFTESAESARKTAAGRPDPLRIPGNRPGWLGGVNLMPYRQRKARLARRRCVFEWCAAAAVGGVAVLTVIGWQAFERHRIDARHAALERTLAQLAAPLAEHAALRHARDEQRKGAVRAAALSAPLQHLRDLLDALSVESGEGVLLQQLRHREHETELLVTSAGSAGSEWLARLRAVRGVKGSEVSDMRRTNPMPAAKVSAITAPRPDAAAVPAANQASDRAAHRVLSQTASQVARQAAPDSAGPIEFSARLLWTDPPQKAARAAAQPMPRSSHTESLRGAQ